MEAFLNSAKELIDAYLATALPKDTLSALVDICQYMSTTFIAVAREYIAVIFA